jgi:crotonobetainyl-CoA:carnitine CoA-transferase CaiB-like acyl-CoA transferase
MGVTGEAEGRPPVRVGTSLIDMGTGMWCAIGILGLLYRRAATGRGGVVDASLFETALGWMTYHAAAFQATGRVPKPQGTGVQGIAPYQAYACSDGWLMIAAGNDKLFARLARVLGHPEWPADPRFGSNPDRSANLADLNGLMAPILRTRTRAAWRELLDAAGVPCAPTQTIDEVLADPQTRALGIVQDTGPRGMPLVGLPLSFDGARPPLRREPPELGEGDAEIRGGGG